MYMTVFSKFILISVIGLFQAKHIFYRILERLPDDPKDDERWEMTVDQISKAIPARPGQVYEVFHVFEALLLITKV